MAVFTQDAALHTDVLKLDAGPKWKHLIGSPHAWRQAVQLLDHDKDAPIWVRKQFMKAYTVCQPKDGWKLLSDEDRHAAHLIFAVVTGGAIISTLEEFKEKLVLRQAHSASSTSRTPKRRRPVEEEAHHQVEAKRQVLVTSAKDPVPSAKDPSVPAQVDSAVLEEAGDSPLKRPKIAVGLSTKVGVQSSREDRLLKQQQREERKLERKLERKKKLHKERKQKQREEQKQADDNDEASSSAVVTMKKKKSSTAKAAAKTAQTALAVSSQKVAASASPKRSRSSKTALVNPIRPERSLALFRMIKNATKKTRGKTARGKPHKHDFWLVAKGEVEQWTCSVCKVDATDLAIFDKTRCVREGEPLFRCNMTHTSQSKNKLKKTSTVCQLRVCLGCFNKTNTEASNALHVDSPGSKTPKSRSKTLAASPKASPLAPGTPEQAFFSSPRSSSSSLKDASEEDEASDAVAGTGGGGKPGELVPATLKRLTSSSSAASASIGASGDDSDDDVTKASSVARAPLPPSLSSAAVLASLSAPVPGDDDPVDPQLLQSPRAAIDPAFPIAAPRTSGDVLSASSPAVADSKADGKANEGVNNKDTASENKTSEKLVDVPMVKPRDPREDSKEEKREDPVSDDDDDGQISLVGDENPSEHINHTLNGLIDSCNLGVTPANHGQSTGSCVYKWFPREDLQLLDSPCAVCKGKLQEKQNPGAWQCVKSFVCTRAVCAVCGNENMLKPPSLSDDDGDDEGGKPTASARAHHLIRSPADCLLPEGGGPFSTGSPWSCINPGCSETSKVPLTQYRCCRLHNGTICPTPGPFCGRCATLITNF